MTIDVKFVDTGREATGKANPKCPNGMAVSCALPGQITCTFNLPYPAPRRGVYSIVCNECKFLAAITVAGRADDPNKVTLPCREKSRC